jgi:uncharacterized membrane protein YeaQ/YmgE (transglycosylase-associated protein family)
MGRNGTANLVLIVFAVVGALVVLPPLFNIAGGLLGLVIMLLIWAVIGFLAGKVVRGQSFGTLGDIVIGLLGGFVGNFLLGIFGIHIPTIVGAIITGVIGAVALIYIIRLFGNRNFAR